MSENKGEGEKLTVTLELEGEEATFWRGCASFYGSIENAILSCLKINRARIQNPRLVDADVNGIASEIIQMVRARVTQATWYPERLSESEAAALLKVLAEVDFTGAGEFARLSDDEEAALERARVKLHAAAGAK